MDHHFGRRVLVLDAAACAGLGVGLAGLAGPLATLTVLPPDLLQAAGLLLLPVAALIAFTASRPVPPSTLVALIVAGNVAWVAASVALLAFGLVAPNALGAALVLGQAAAVLVLALLEARSFWPRQAVRAA